MSWDQFAQTPRCGILVAIEPADFRKGIDGLVRVCKESLRDAPFAGAVFAFRNRRTRLLAAHQLLVHFSAGNPDRTAAA